MKNNFFSNIAIVISILIILGVVFTIDDVTGLGLVLDPLEFIATGGIAYYLAKR